jgi:hypothetical protein
MTHVHGLHRDDLGEPPARALCRPADTPAVSLSHRRRTVSSPFRFRRSSQGLHVRSALLLVFIAALGQALHLHTAAQPRLAYVLLAVAMGAVALAALERRFAFEISPGLVAAAALAVLALQSWELLVSPPQWAMREEASVFAVLAFGIVLALIAAVGGIVRGGRAGIAGSVILAAVALWLCVYVVHATPHPWIDVHVFHVEAFRDLLAGRDPYGQTRPNIYRGQFAFYAPEVLTPDARRVLVGFPYPPLQLLATLPVHLLTGEYRYLHAVALAASAALMLAARPGRPALIGAALFLLTPKIFYVVEGSWTEPLVVLALSATLFCAVRAPRALPWTFGCLLAIKQYTVALAPLAPLLLPDAERTRRGVLALLGRAAIVVAAVDLPFLLWNARGFVADTVTFLVRQPLRVDSLSWSALAKLDGLEPATWFSFALLAALLAACLFRAERTARGFAASTALAFCVFFAFAKAAFVNYYLFPLAAGAWALALSPSSPGGATSAANAQTVNQGT